MYIPTDFQKQIELIVTNGMGYLNGASQHFLKTNKGTDSVLSFSEAEKEIHQFLHDYRRCTPEQLRCHLAEMDFKTNPNQRLGLIINQYKSLVKYIGEMGWVDFLEQIRKVKNKSIFR